MSLEMLGAVTLTKGKGNVLGPAQNVPGPPKNVVVIISPKSSLLDVGKTQQLSFLVNGSPATGNVSWSSSNSVVASVDGNGLVTGVKAGNAMVTGKQGSNTGGASITVKASSTPGTGCTQAQKDAAIAAANNAIKKGKVAVAKGTKALVAATKKKDANKQKLAQAAIDAGNNAIAVGNALLVSANKMVVSIGGYLWTMKDATKYANAEIRLGGGGLPPGWQSGDQTGQANAGAALVKMLQDTLAAQTTADAADAAAGLITDSGAVLQYIKISVTVMAPEFVSAPTTTSDAVAAFRAAAPPNSIPAYDAQGYFTGYFSGNSVAHTYQQDQGSFITRAGSSAQATATGTYTDGTRVDLKGDPGFTWSSSNTSVATVDPASGAITPLKAGDFFLKATMVDPTGTAGTQGPITAQMKGKVMGAGTAVPAGGGVITSISLAPASVGQGSQVQLVVTGNMSDGTQQDVTSACTFTSTMPTIASVVPGGVVTGLAQGTGQVVASIPAGSASGFNVATALNSTGTVTVGPPGSTTAGPVTATTCQQAGQQALNDANTLQSLLSSANAMVSSNPSLTSLISQATPAVTTAQTAGNAAVQTAANTASSAAQLQTAQQAAQFADTAVTNLISQIQQAMSTGQQQQQMPTSGGGGGSSGGGGFSDGGAPSDGGDYGGDGGAYDDGSQDGSQDGGGQGGGLDTTSDPFADDGSGDDGSDDGSLDMLGAIGFDFGGIAKMIPGVLQTAGGALSDKTGGGKPDAAMQMLLQEQAKEKQEAEKTAKNMKIGLIVVGSVTGLTAVGLVLRKVLK